MKRAKLIREIRAAATHGQGGYPDQSLMRLANRLDKNKRRMDIETRYQKLRPRVKWCAKMVEKHKSSLNNNTISQMESIQWDMDKLKAQNEKLRIQESRLRDVEGNLNVLENRLRFVVTQKDWHNKEKK